MSEQEASRRLEVLAPGVSVVVPVYNVELTPPDLGNELMPVLEDLGLPYEWILVNDGSRDASWETIRELASKGINAVFHYIPLHASPMGLRFGYREGQFPVTEDTSRRLLRLPLFFNLEPADQDRVIQEVFEFFGRRPD